MFFVFFGGGGIGMYCTWYKSKIINIELNLIESLWVRIDVSWKMRNHQCFKKSSRLTCHSKLPQKAPSTPWPQGFSLVGQLCINQLREYRSDYISVRHKHYVSCHFRPRQRMTLCPQAPATVSALDFCQSQWKSYNKHDDMFVSFNATSNIRERWRGAAAPAHGDTVTFFICSPARADHFWKLNFLQSRLLQRRKKKRKESLNKALKKGNRRYSGHV